MIITLSKGKSSIRVSINTDASYRIWLNNRWSVTYPDFAEKYIQLRDAGFVETRSQSDYGYKENHYLVSIDVVMNRKYMVMPYLQRQTEGTL